MLQAIHDRIMGVIGWIILTLLIVAFALWGVYSYLKPSAENYAAKVNGTDISTAELQRSYGQAQAQIREAMGNNYDPEKIDEAELRKSTLNRLINDELLAQAADSAGLAASESALATQISSVDQFKNKGVFSKEQYTRVLGYQGMTPSLFEWKLSREIVTNQLMSGITLTAAATDATVKDMYALQAQQRRFNYIVIPESSVKDQVALSEQDIEKYYNAHPDQFRTPERVRVQYLDLNAAELKPGKSVDEAQIKALYAEQHDKFVTPEQRHARHILIAAKSDSDADMAAALKKANDIEKRLDQGEDFAELAKKYSDDPGSSSKGGDLGTFGKGIMVPEVEQAIFSMKQGERSKPVKSQYGYHIIELLGIVPEVVKPLDAVRSELVSQLTENDRVEQYSDKLETLSNMAFEQPDSLEGPATSLGLKVQESDWFSRSGGNGIAKNPKVVSAAFSDDVLKGGNNSAPVEVGDNHVVVVRVVDHQAAALPPLKEIHDKVAEAARKEAITQLLKLHGESMLAELRSGKSTMDSIAAALHEKINYNILLPRTSETPSAFLVKRVFTLPRAALNKPVYDGVMQAEGGYVLIDLEEVQDGNYAALTESARKQFRQSLNKVRGQSDVKMMMDGIRAAAKIQIPESTPQ